MNKSLAFGIVVLTAVATSSYGQGTVTFVNQLTNRIYRVETQTYLANNPPGAYKVQLYWLPGDLPEPTTDMFTAATKVGNAANIGVPVPGRFSGGTITIPTSTPGGPVWLQVKAWGTAFGDTYEEVATLGPCSGLAATSNIFRLAATGDPTTIPAGTPGTLNQMVGIAFWNCPEPGSIALGLLGFGALVLLRRRSQVVAPTSVFGQKNRTNL